MLPFAATFLLSRNVGCLHESLLWNINAKLFLSFLRFVSTYANKRDFRLFIVNDLVIGTILCGKSGWLIALEALKGTSFLSTMFSHRVLEEILLLYLSCCLITRSTASTLKWLWLTCTRLSFLWNLNIHCWWIFLLLEFRKAHASQALFHHSKCLCKFKKKDLW